MKKAERRRRPCAGSAEHANTETVARRKTGADETRKERPTRGALPGRLSTPTAASNLRGRLGRRRAAIEEKVERVLECVEEGATFGFARAWMGRSADSMSLRRADVGLMCVLYHYF